MNDFSLPSHMPQAPGILWAAPYCLHDSSSGAAAYMRNAFTQLTKRGFRCHVVSALTFDAPSGTAAFPNLEEQLKQSDAQWFDVQDRGVQYQYLRTKSTAIGDMTRDEELLFYQRFSATVQTFKPDILLIFGCCVLEMSIIAECHRKGIGTCVYALNGGYRNFHFPEVDLLLTESLLSAQYYRGNNNINMLPVGPFIEPQQAICAERVHLAKQLLEHTVSHAELTARAPYITYINPCPTKGISLVLRLALMAREKYPEWKFLVVESRGTWAQALATFQQDPTLFENVSVAQHTTDIRLVYDQTKVLLAPSIAYEGFGRVAAEATMNGIPVIASNSGGLPNAVNGGGLNLETPEACRKDVQHMPTEEEVAPWFAALEEMMHEETYPAWIEKAFEAATGHDIEKSTDRLVHYLTPLLHRRASYHPHYFIRS